MAISGPLQFDETSRQGIWAEAVIDCDVHANVPSFDALFPYMDPMWVTWAKERLYHGPTWAATVYPPNAPTTARSEWRPEGCPPASELSLLREHVLDPWNVDFAVLNCYYGIDNVRHPDWAAAMASAINDWLIDQWFTEPRLVGSIVVPARDPAAMVREIERVGDHPSFRQVLMPVRNDRLYGDRIYHPVYEAMERHDLVLGLHWGGTTEGAPSPTGWASWFVEEYAAEWGNFAAQIVSLISEGVFKASPRLRVSVLEGGFTWLPSWGWRMNKEWKGLHREVPWLDKPPFDVIREHMRFSIAPADAGPPEAMEQVIEWLGSDDILMFATDYPHGHETDVAALLAVMPESMRSKMMSETARDWYRL
jgi:predicted TIM-barrel fold metal-dependent hydrolase